MYKLYEFFCKPCECLEEVLVEPDEIVLCPECSQPMEKILSAVTGYVKGTKTPVSYTKYK